MNLDKGYYVRWHVWKRSLHELFFEDAKNFSQKNAPNFSPNFRAFILWVQRNPVNFRRNFPAKKKQVKFTDELQERREKVLFGRGEKTPTPKISALLRKRPVLLRAVFRPY